MNTASYTIHRGEVWNLKGSPFDGSRPEDVFESIKPGALVVNESGTIAFVGTFAEAAKKTPQARVIDHGDCVLVPGFVDAHLHYPQLDMIGSHGKGLLDWLDHYTFPEEEGFSDRSHAAAVAKRLCHELIANGVTTAAIFSSSHTEATDALFTAAEIAGLRIIAGKVAMDRNCPEALKQPLNKHIEDTKALIEKWHRKSPLIHYALTPRFAPACSPELLSALGQLKEKFPTVYVQSHHAETADEVALVKSLFPNQRDYLSVYETFGLLGKTTLLGHGIYSTPEERKMLAKTETKIVHCPTSNMFLGSGLLNFSTLNKSGVTVCLGSDIGGGTSVSPFRTMAAAYKTQALQQSPLHPVDLLYLATLGGAKSLCLENETGNFEIGKSADFSVLNPHENRLLSTRFNREHDPLIRLFATIIHGDDRIIKNTYVRGKCILSLIEA